MHHTGERLLQAVRRNNLFFEIRRNASLQAATLAKDLR
jgi:hypothetical protein